MVYDRFGNRRFKLGTTLPASQDIEHDALHNPAISPATNRIEAGQGYGYDEGASNSVGNLTSAPGYTYTYDAENRIVTSNYAAPNQQAMANSYAYDGDGRRVQKVSANGQVAEVYVYDALGQLVAEYNTLLRVRQGETSYLTGDTLGTPRVVTKADGSVKSRHDYLPFGEEIGSEIGGRNAVPQYGQTDNVKQQFTGKERDYETGLDYFGARYYSGVHGRFTSVDPLAISKRHIANPQRWNGYVYVLNAPLSLVDPNGQEGKGSGGGRIIDVFIVIPSKQLEGPRPDWAALKQRAMEQYGTKVNVYTIDSGQVSSQRILKSMTTPGRYTVVATHSFSDPRGGVVGEGVRTGNGYIGSFGVTTEVKNGRGEVIAGRDSPLPEVKAAAVMFISCFPGNDFHGVIGSHLSSSSVAYYNRGGDDGSCWTGSIQQAAYSITEALAAGETPAEAAQVGNQILSQPAPYSDGDHMQLISPGTDVMQEVRHHLQSRWLNERDRLKDGQS